MQTYTVVNENIIKDLVAIVGNKYVLTEKDRLVLYGQDEGADRKAYRLPEAVVLPATTEEVAAVMQLAVKYHIAVIPRGAGTGLEGGAVANQYGGIILSTERMNAVLEINDECLYARVEAGVITADLQSMAAAKGLLYAGDPCSGDSCFIGGNAATNAGGNRAVKYGTTRDQVYAVKMVTPKGEIVELGGRLKKSSTGYALEKVVIGAEGTLGIITEVTVRLVPLPPVSVHILSVFSSAQEALSLVTALPKNRIETTCLEFMDNESIRAVERFTGERQVASEKGNYMIIQVDCRNEDEADDICMQVDEICRTCGATEVFMADADKIWKARKIFSEASGAEGPVAMEDFVVPPDCIAELLQELQLIGERTGLCFRGVSHAGDGNIHLDILRNGLTDTEWERRLAEYEKEAYTAVYAKGGKISGEHGIGTVRKAFMVTYMDPVELELMKALKKAWDPDLILNPGKIFDIDK